VVAEVPGPGGGFDHAHQGILGWRGEQGMVGEKLIAEDPDQTHIFSLSKPRASGSKNGLFRREAAKE